MTNVHRVRFVPHSYTEDESFQCVGSTEPLARSQDIIFMVRNTSSRIKVTLITEDLETLSSFEHDSWNSIYRPSSNKLQRCQAFRAFIACINFERLPLLNNTVSELCLQHTPVRSQETLPLVKDVDSVGSLALNVCNLAWNVQEDKSRVVYPPHIDSTLPVLWLTRIRTKHLIVGGVSRVELYRKQGFYIYKEIDRPFYTPQDSEIIQQEVRNLSLFRGVPNIVQLVAVMISTNPYQTIIQDDNTTVIRGILLEYCSGGTLEQILLNLKELRSLPWHRWPLQIGEGLNNLHQEGITHMDIKPPNIVLDCYGNAVIIDISGVGGVSYEWLAPEMRQTKEPLSLPLEERKKNDVWAYGMLLMAILGVLTGTKENVNIIREVALGASEWNPEVRATLCWAISRLQQPITGP